IAPRVGAITFIRTNLWTQRGLGNVILCVQNRRHRVFREQEMKKKNHTINTQQTSSGARWLIAMNV
uniref:Uncharacterized protein n=1 Tax=Petromyzon marinus TaxID=7757 RepID=S4RYB7_PETMA